MMPVSHQPTKPETCPTSTATFYTGPDLSLLVDDLRRQLAQQRDRADKAEAACAAKDSALASVPHLADHLVRAEREMNPAKAQAHRDCAQTILEAANTARQPNPGQAILDRLAELQALAEMHRKAASVARDRVLVQDVEIERLREVVEKFREAVTSELGPDYAAAMEGRVWCLECKGYQVAGKHTAAAEAAKEKRRAK